MGNSTFLAQVTSTGPAVWYQTYSGGPRWYSISIYNPHGRRVFYRSGVAPSSSWRNYNWRPINDPDLAPNIGTCRVVYHVSSGYQTYRVHVFCGE